MLLSRCVLVVCVIQPWFVTFTPQVMLLNGVKRPKLLDPSRSPMHHRDTSTGQVCPLGTPMYRLQHWAARKKPLQLRTIETTLKALFGDEYPFPVLPANLLIARSVGPSGALRTAIMQRPRRGEVRGLAS